MGVDYSICLVAERPMDQYGRISSLDDTGFSYRIPATGRWPSLNEVRAVARTLRDEFSWVVEEHIYSHRYSVNFDRCIEVHKREDGSQWIESTEGGTTLECEEYNGDENTPLKFSFYRGWPDAIVTVAELLSRICGDFQVISDFGLIVVTPGTAPDAEWWDGNDEDDAAE